MLSVDAGAGRKTGPARSWSSQELVLGGCGGFVMSDDVGEGTSGLLCLRVVEDNQPDEYEDSCRERKTNTQQQQETGKYLAFTWEVPGQDAHDTSLPLPGDSLSSLLSPPPSGEPFGWDML